MPFVSKSEIALAQRGNELTVRAGAYKRQILLPRVLAGRRATGASMNGDRLDVSFTRED
jgi:arsenite-transporting ATPase